MVEYENECVGCPTELGCIGDGCQHRKVPHYYCDECGEETKLYRLGEKEYCKDCVIQFLEVVEGSN